MKKSTTIYNAAIMSRSRFLVESFNDEDRFTAITNMYVNHNYPGLRGFYYHIPNESESTRHHVKGRFTQSDLDRIRQAAKGVLPGVPDFCFMLPYVWYLELKMPNGTLSQAQTKLHKAWGEKKIVIHTAFNAMQVCSVMDGMIGKPLYP